MRRILLALSTTAVAVVLLFGYRTSTPHPGTTAVAAAPTAPSGGATTGSGPSSGAPAAKTVDGPVAQTRWGPVQVRLTVSGGRVTAADAVQVPSGNGRDAEINAYAVPILDAEVVQAQSADIDAVSGATVTSNGYVTSLQAALDAAGL